MPRRAGRSLQAWAIGGDGVPRSLGLVADGATPAVTVSPEARALVAAGATLAVSDEPAGGSTGPLPSGPVLATGALVRL